MESHRTWGKPPNTIVVVHGGPGAPGSIAPIARELSRDCGVLEPFQTEKTLNGQVQELEQLLERHANLPCIIIGWSHGASLSCILAAKYPDSIRKLIIIGTTPFEEKYQADIARERLRRLSEQERIEFISLATTMRNSSDREPRTEAMARLFRLAAKEESHTLLPHEDDVLEYQPNVNESIGREYHRLFDGNRLLRILPDIRCPVVAIHGDYDVLPAEGVKEPFSRLIKDFRFIVLEKCGHYPWYERYARDAFFTILRDETLEKTI